MFKNIEKTQLLLFALLIVAAVGWAGTGWWGWQQAQQHNAIEIFQQAYPKLDPAVAVMEKNDRIVNLQPLRNELYALTDTLGPDAITIYIETFNTGANISINNTLRIWPASLAKLPLGMAVAKKLELGTWQKHNELVLLNGDRDPSWGQLYNKPIGTTFTIEELLKELLVNSDNTAYKILYRNMETEELMSIIRETGLEELFNEEGKIGSKDYSRLLRSLYASSYLSREYSQLILDHLAASSYTEYLQQGIPAEVPFSHKIGENRDVEVVSDAGIVYLQDRPYLITVMIDRKAGKGMSREAALELMKTISEKTYMYFATYDTQNS